MESGQAWSSRGLPEGEQFAAWAAVSSEAFCPVTVTRPDDGGFAGEVAARPLGPLGVSEIRSQAQAVARTQAQVDNRSGDLFFVNLPLDAGTFARQDGRTAALGAGDFTIVDSTRPFELEFAARFRQVSVAVPHELLAGRLADPAGAMAVRVRGDRGVGAIAGAAMRAAAGAGAFDRDSGAVLADQLCGLIALALGGVTPATVRGHRALLRQAAFDEIERSLGDPALAPGDVARQLAISSRYLHALFAEAGTSFGRALLARRLERSWSALADPGQRHRSIADIAFAHGFTDPSYFARVFRGRYGHPPGDLRRRVTGDSTVRARPITVH